MTPPRISNKQSRHAVRQGKSESPDSFEDMEPQPPIAWQRYLNHSSGFTEAVAEKNGVYQPHHFGKEAEIGKVVKWDGKGWLGDTTKSNTHDYGVQNKSEVGKEIALCCFSEKDEDKDKPYIPVVLLGLLDKGSEFHCTAPVLLQGYVRYTEPHT
ncbi:hypothetical protein B0H14DRAFT_2655646 [Mycena olivaceomarginata]|nr:hypothetical protein B0H14DRAFT_2655646 [Mycena olivaceomarginata]